MGRSSPLGPVRTSHSAARRARARWQPTRNSPGSFEVPFSRSRQRAGRHRHESRGKAAAAFAGRLGDWNPGPCSPGRTTCCMAPCSHPQRRSARPTRVRAEPACRLARCRSRYHAPARENVPQTNPTSRLARCRSRYHAPARESVPQTNPTSPFARGFARRSGSRRRPSCQRARRSARNLRAARPCGFLGTSLCKWTCHVREALTRKHQARGTEAVVTLPPPHATPCQRTCHIREQRGGHRRHNESPVLPRAFPLRPPLSPNGLDTSERSEPKSLRRKVGLGSIPHSLHQELS